MPRSSLPHSRLDEIHERGLIRIAIRWAPSAEQYKDPDTGEPAGIVGLLGIQMAKDLGVRAEFVDLTWADHIPALLEDRVDICMKHTNTPERAQKVEFSTGRVLRYEGKIVVRSDRGILDENDLNQTHRIFACGEGDSQEAQIRDSYPLAQVHFYPKTENALAAVDSGEADACLADQSVPDFLLLHPECTTLTDENNEPVRTSIDYSHPMIKPGDQRFLNWVDNWMDFHAVQGTIEQIKQEAHTAFRAKFERIVGMSED